MSPCEIESFEVSGVRTKHYRRTQKLMIDWVKNWFLRVYACVYFLFISHKCTETSTHPYTRSVMHARTDKIYMQIFLGLCLNPFFHSMALTCYFAPVSVKGVSPDRKSLTKGLFFFLPFFVKWRQATEHRGKALVPEEDKQQTENKVCQCSGSQAKHPTPLCNKKQTLKIKRKKIKCQNKLYKAKDN